jgi:hypothetical protein
MSENSNETLSLPEDKNNFTDQEVTTPQTESDVIVPVKFNKQIINLSLQQAQELAQKGMKFDAIAKDYDAIKNLAKADGKSVGEFIADIECQRRNSRQSEILGKCGDDTEFAEYVLALEKGKGDEVKGFDEVMEAFAQIKSIDDLPESVVEAAKMKGTLLLDEYLRYLHNQDVLMKNTIKKQRESEQSAMGSMLNMKGAENPETAEFLRGLWHK